VFHINIPIFKIIIGLLLIYFGLRILTGSSVVDLFKVSEDELSKSVKVDVVFGS
jgi:small neutral amino acid transporter SnatA (MarC family)